MNRLASTSLEEPETPVQLRPHHPVPGQAIESLGATTPSADATNQILASHVARPQTKCLARFQGNLNEGPFLFLNKLQVYFAKHRIVDEEKKLGIAAKHLAGKAQNWFEPYYSITYSMQSSPHYFLPSIIKQSERRPVLHQDHQDQRRDHEYRDAPRSDHEFNWDSARSYTSCRHCQDEHWNPDCSQRNAPRPQENFNRRRFESHRNMQRRARSPRDKYHL